MLLFKKGVEQSLLWLLKSKGQLYDFFTDV